MKDTTRNRIQMIVQLSLQLLIVYSVVTMALETMPSLESYDQFFRVSEIVVVTVFTIEYLVAWWLSDNRLKHPFRLLSILDLLAILPFYLSLTIDLRTVRAIRLMRIFRVLKLGRYNRAMRTIGMALKRTGPEIGVVFLGAGIMIVISAMALYYAEHDAQPQVYSSIPASLWWAVTTLTTVGYGDVSPITPTGKIVAAVVMLTGIGLIALPTSLISGAMTDILQEQRKEIATGSS